MNKFGNVYRKIFDYSLKKINKVYFEDLLFTAKPIVNLKMLTTTHLYNEMPIRISKRIRDLNALPFGLNHNHNVNIIRDWYITSFCELIEIKSPKTENDCDEFREKIKIIYDRHSSVIITLNKGLFELKESGHFDKKDEEELQLFLNKFHSSRTEIRILIEHYLKLFNDPDNKNKYGAIDMNLNLKDTIKTACHEIKIICEKQNYDFDIDSIKINGNASLPYIKNYLHYIIFEIIKNSTQAILDKNALHPNVDISIKDVEEYIIVKITDNGIGINKKNINNIWLYSFTTHQIPSQNIINSNDFYNESPLSGFGYGLPICKIYLDFFGGFIKIESIENIGTVVYIFLRNYNFTNCVQWK